MKDILGQLACDGSCTAHYKQASVFLSMTEVICDLRPPGMNTVLPSSEPLYCPRTCKAVTPASGSDAASAKERTFGFKET